MSQKCARSLVLGFIRMQYVRVYEDILVLILGPTATPLLLLFYTVFFQSKIGYFIGWTLSSTSLPCPHIILLTKAQALPLTNIITTNSMQNSREPSQVPVPALPASYTCTHSDCHLSLTFNIHSFTCRIHTINWVGTIFISLRNMTLATHQQGKTFRKRLDSYLGPSLYSTHSQVELLGTYSFEISPFIDYSRHL